MKSLIPFLIVFFINCSGYVTSRLFKTSPEFKFSFNNWEIDKISLGASDALKEIDYYYKTHFFCDFKQIDKKNKIFPFFNNDLVVDSIFIKAEGNFHKSAQLQNDYGSINNMFNLDSSISFVQIQKCIRDNSYKITPYSKSKGSIEPFLITLPLFKEKGCDFNKGFSDTVKINNANELEQYVSSSTIKAGKIMIFKDIYIPPHIKTLTICFHAKIINNFTFEILETKYFEHTLYRKDKKTWTLGY